MKKEKELNAEIARFDEERKEMVIPEKLELTIEGFKTDNKRSALYTVEELEREVKEDVPFYQKKMNNI
jgi:hypothetical protein